MEEICGDLRRETAVGVTEERCEQVTAEIVRYGERVIHAATSGQPVPDMVKGRVLNVVLALMNLRENLDRAAARRMMVRVL